MKGGNQIPNLELSTYIHLDTDYWINILDRKLEIKF